MQKKYDVDYETNEDEIVYKKSLIRSMQNQIDDCKAKVAAFPQKILDFICEVNEVKAKKKADMVWK